MADSSEYHPEQPAILPIAKPEPIDEKPGSTWGIVQEARQIARTLPAEDALPINMAPITFARAHRRRGLAVIFTVGTVVGTPHDGVSLVPERTRIVLQRMGIPFTIYTPAQRKSE